jgi:hypothetical protein
MSRKFATTTLFSVSARPTPTNWDDIDLKGIAEWRAELPILFKALFCSDSDPFAFPNYDTDRPSALIMTQQAAENQLSRIGALLPSGLSPLAAHALAILQAQGLAYVVLDFDKTLGMYPAERGFPKALNIFKAGLDEINREVEAAERNGCISPEHPELFKLIADTHRSWGYWDPRVDYAVYNGFGEEPDVPPFELHDMPSDRYVYESNADWYRLKPDRVNGRGEGVLSPYGRWWVHPDLGFDRTYEHDLDKGWITAARLPDGSTIAENDSTYFDALQWQIFDANGVAIGDEIFDLVLIASATLAVIKRVGDTGDDGELYHLPSRRWLGIMASNVSVRDDGSITYMTGSYGGDHRLGLIDTEGNIIAGARYRQISQFHKKLGLAVIAEGEVNDGYTHGLINRAGEEVVSARYRFVRVSSRDGPPSFVADRVWVLDTDLRLGAVSACGVEVIKPEHPILLPGDFFTNNLSAHWVDVGGEAWELNLDGGLSNHFGPVAAFREGRKHAFSTMTVGEVEQKLTWLVNRKTLSDALRREPFRELLELLCSDRVALDDAWQRLEQTLAGDDTCVFDMSLDVTSDESAEQLLFRERFWPFPRTMVDWKATDSINGFAVAFPEVSPAFDGFQWEGEALGEDIGQGFQQASRWLEKSELVLMSIYTGSDSFLLGICAIWHVPRLQDLASQLNIGITIL